MLLYPILSNRLWALCFRFTLTDEATGHSSTLDERFIFNLNWSPEDFKEIVPDTADLVDSGELEMRVSGAAIPGAASPGVRAPKRLAVRTEADR